MKAVVKPLLINLFIIVMFGCSSNSEDDSYDYEGWVSHINFSTTNLILEEGGEGTTVTIDFNKPAYEDGIITIKATNLKDLEVNGATIEEDNIILVHFYKNDSSVSFKILRPEDEIISENVDLLLNLESATDPVGIFVTNRTVEINIKDNELTGYPHSYRSGSANKKTFYYNLDGRLVKSTSNSLSFENSSYANYIYDDDGKLIEINSTQDNSKTLFFYENNKLVRSETGSRIVYFETNSDGQIISSFYKQLDNENTHLQKYSYFSNGSISEVESISTTYSYTDWGGEEIKLDPPNVYTSTTTYSQDKTSMFPSFRILPNQLAPYGLPLSESFSNTVNGEVTTGTNGQYSYVFNGDNKLIETSYNGNKIVYSYY